MAFHHIRREIDVPVRVGEASQDGRAETAPKAGFARPLNTLPLEAQHGT